MFSVSSFDANIYNVVSSKFLSHPPKAQSGELNACLKYFETAIYQRQTTHEIKTSYSDKHQYNFPFDF